MLTVKMLPEDLNNEESGRLLIEAEGLDDIGFLRTLAGVIDGNVHTLLIEQQEPGVVKFDGKDFWEEDGEDDDA